MDTARGPKERLFAVCYRIPVIKELADPIIATVLVFVLLIAVVGITIPGAIFPHDSGARGHVMQAVGGLVVIFGAYYASVNLREARAQQYLERLSTIITQVGNPNEAVRLGAIRMLQSTALERPALPSDSMAARAVNARRMAISEVLESVSNEGDRREARLAATVLAELRDWETGG
jgi:hypothetical protein